MPLLPVPKGLGNAGILLSKGFFPPLPVLSLLHLPINDVFLSSSISRDGISHPGLVIPSAAPTPGSGRNQLHFRLGLESPFRFPKLEEFLQSDNSSKSWSCGSQRPQVSHRTCQVLQCPGQPKAPQPGLNPEFMEVNPSRFSPSPVSPPSMNHLGIGTRLPFQQPLPVIF